MMRGALVAVALVASQDHTGIRKQAYDLKVALAVGVSSACLFREVMSRVGDSAVKLTADDRNQIRIAAATACFEDDVRIAKLSDDYRRGRKTLDEATVDMLVTSQRVAEGYIAAKLADNSEKLSAHAPNQ
jgi:hypothetical protein